MAGATGLEPATSCVTGRRSNQLNNAPQNLTVMMTSTTCTALQGLLGLSGASMPFCRDSLARGLENLRLGLFKCHEIASVYQFVMKRSWTTLGCGKYTESRMKNLSPIDLISHSNGSAIGLPAEPNHGPSYSVSGTMLDVRDTGPLSVRTARVYPGEV